MKDEVRRGYGEGNSGVVIAIMAGGGSRRMGRDKAEIEMGGRRWLERTVEIARLTRCRVVVVGRAEVEGRSIDGVDFIEDEVPSEGPLRGLATVLRYTKSSVLALACDMPLLRVEAIEWLLLRAGSLSGRYGVITRNGGRMEPLFSIYASTVLTSLDRLLDNGDRSMRSMLESLSFHHVDIPASLSDWLRNVNTPEELEALRAERPGATEP